MDALYDELGEGVGWLAASTVAPSTRKAYASAWRMFERFGVLVNKPVWPATTELVERYIVYMVRWGRVVGR